MICVLGLMDSVAILLSANWSRTSPYIVRTWPNFIGTFGIITLLSAASTHLNTVLYDSLYVGIFGSVLQNAPTTSRAAVAYDSFGELCGPSTIAGLCSEPPVYVFLTGRAASGQYTAASAATRNTTCVFRESRYITPSMINVTAIYGVYIYMCNTTTRGYFGRIIACGCLDVAVLAVFRAVEYALFVGSFCTLVTATSSGDSCATVVCWVICARMYRPNSISVVMYSPNFIGSVRVARLFVLWLLHFFVLQLTRLSIEINTYILTGVC